MSQKSFTVSAQERNSFGSAAARRIRREGLVPLVVYSRGEEPKPLALSATEAERLSQHHGMVEVKIDGRRESTSAIVRDIQVHPLTQSILHLDCLGVRADEEISVNVPLEAVGESPGLSQGGILDQLHYAIEVTCLPGDVPEIIQVDVGGLAMGDSLSIADLPALEGIAYQGDPEETVFVISVPTEEPSEEELEEGEEGAEPELVGAETAETEDEDEQE